LADANTDRGEDVVDKDEPNIEGKGGCESDSNHNGRNGIKKGEDNPAIMAMMAVEREPLREELATTGELMTGEPTTGEVMTRFYQMIFHSWIKPLIFMCQSQEETMAI
jgi:hypothetical protein